MKRVFQVFLISIYLIFGADYFSTFKLFENEQMVKNLDLCFQNIAGVELEERVMSFSNIEKGNDIMCGDGVIIKRYTFGTADQVFCLLKLKNFIQKCFSKTSGDANSKLVLKFDGYVLYWRDKIVDFVAGSDSYDTEELDAKCCTFYVIHKDILHSSDHIVVFRHPFSWEFLE